MAKRNRDRSNNLWSNIVFCIVDEQNVNIFSLSKQDTNFLKGIAIFAMLCHHLYGCPIDGVVPYTGIFAWIGNFGKICVAIFLFCSGYGLSAGYENTTNTKGKLRFVLNRLIKFYTNYWFILLLFIPFGVFILGRTFDIAYAGLNIPKRILFEILGINGGCSYIRTWWFNQLILVLYLIFPLLYEVIKRVPILAFVISVVYLLLGDAYTFRIIELNIWLFPFIVGIYWKLFEGQLDKITFADTKAKISYALISLIFLGLAILLRSKLSDLNELRVDAIVTISIVLSVIFICRNSSTLMRGGAFLGKYSMNMYLIHSFFNVPRLHECEWLRGGG